MERPGGGRGKEEFSLSFQPCWLGSDFWLPDLWENAFPFFLKTLKFIVIFEETNAPSSCFLMLTLTFISVMTNEWCWTLLQVLLAISVSSSDKYLFRSFVLLKTILPFIIELWEREREKEREREYVCCSDQTQGSCMVITCCTTELHPRWSCKSSLCIFCVQVPH
jgi:hypothetical protein